MKRFGIPLFTLPAIGLLVLLVACQPGAQTGGSSGVSSTGATAQPKQQQQQLSIVTARTGGVYPVIGAAIAKVVNKYAPGVNINAEGSGGGQENAKLVGEKKAELGLATAEILYLAKTGQFVYKDKYEDLRMVFGSFDSDMQAMALASSGIKSLRDLKGKKVGTTPGLTTEFQAPAMLEPYGIKPGDYTKVSQLTEDSVNGLKDGNIDAIIAFSGTPSAAYTDLATSHKIRFLGLDPEAQKQISQKHPYFRPDTLPVGLYPGIDQPVPIMAVSSMVVTHKDVDTDAIYKITKAVFENLKELAEIHPACKEFSVENTLRDANNPLPLHPGAERYLKEKGHLK